MSDLLTHYATGRLVLAGQKEAHLRWMLLWGTVWPDLLAKGFFYLTRSKPAFCYPTHSLAGMVLTCYAFTFLFEESKRQRYFLAMLLGSMLHLLVDSFKNDLGAGARVFLPWSTRSFEFGLYPHENIVYAIPAALVLIAIIEGIERMIGKRPAPLDTK